MTEPTEPEDFESEKSAGADRRRAIEAIADAIESTGTVSENPEGD
jgi:hypothetical protein